MKRLLILFAIVILSGLFYVDEAWAEAETVSYGGVWTIGDEGGHPIYSRNKEILGGRIEDLLRIKNEQQKLPFRLLFETGDIEEAKWNIDDPLTLAVVITRDDVTKEIFEDLGQANTTVNAGMNLIVYSTRLEAGKEINRIVFSAPLVGVAKIENTRVLTEDEINEHYLNTAIGTLDKYLLQRLIQVPIGKTEGKVQAVRGGNAILNIGIDHELRKGDPVRSSKTGEKIGFITEVSLQSAVIKLEDGVQVFRYMPVYTRAIEARAGNMMTYQVVDCTLKSKRAQEVFKDTPGIKAKIAEDFSNYIADRAGKVVLPSKVGGTWVESATKESLIKLVRGGAYKEFAVPEPRYSVRLEVTSLVKSIMQMNNVSANYIYKAWISVAIPEQKDPKDNKAYVKEFDTFVKKHAATKGHSYSDEGIYIDLLEELTAKIAREGSF